MCKLFITSGINSSNRDKAIELIVAMSDIIGQTMRDGIGYAATDESGNLFGERWHRSEEAFSERAISSLSSRSFDIASSYNGVLSPIGEPERYNSFGDVNLENITAITLHGRYATSSKEFKNTHPFITGDTSLVHNGVIRNAFKFNLTQSTCDSEAILNLYNTHKVNRFPSNVQAVSDQLEGYFACGVFTRSKTGERVLDIFKDDTANLTAAWIEELSIMVFVTNVKDLNDACEIVGLTVSNTFKFKSGSLIRINPLTGTVLCTETFNLKSEHHSKYLPSMRSESLLRMMREEPNSDDGYSIDIDKVLGK